ncbi:MAG TPA: hypothetical protein VF272_04020 [Candidatus Saccharimonadia bacterium]
MKKKEIIQLTVAGAIIAFAGLLFASQLGAPKSDSKKGRYTYEDVRPIKSDYAPELIEKITDSEKVKDFYLPPDLNSGIGNQTPFKPIN